MRRRGFPASVRANANRRFECVAARDLVDQSDRFGACRVDRITAEDQRERFLDAGQPRRTLRSACSRQQAALDLWKAHARGRSRDAVVAAQRELEPTASTLPSSAATIGLLDASSASMRSRVFGRGGGSRRSPSCRRRR